MVSTKKKKHYIYTGRTVKVSHCFVRFGLNITNENLVAMQSFTAVANEFYSVRLRIKRRKQSL